MTGKLFRKFAVVAALAASLSATTAAAPTTATATDWGTTVWFASFSQQYHQWTCIAWSLGSVGSGQVKDRGNDGYNRYYTCLSATSGNWYYGTHYAGGGIKTCAASGNFSSVCELNPAVASDPYIKNRNSYANNGSGAHYWK